MKTTSKVFAIIGIVCGAITFILSLYNKDHYRMLYGLYCVGISVGSLISLLKDNKVAILVTGIINVPCMAIGSVFMFVYYGQLSRNSERIKKENNAKQVEDNSHINDQERIAKLENELAKLKEQNSNDFDENK